MIIWGDEHSNATKEADLKGWFEKNAAVFGEPDVGRTPPAAGVATPRPRLGGSRDGAAARPPAVPIPRGGPIPPYTVCSL